MIGGLTDGLYVFAELSAKVSEEISEKLFKVHICSEILWNYVLI